VKKLPVGLVKSDRSVGGTNFFTTDRTMNIGEVRVLKKDMDLIRSCLTSLVGYRATSALVLRRNVFKP
jgi:hypothetical protein